MKIRNEQLHAEIARVVEVKLKVPPLKQIAEKYQVRVQTVRQLVSKAMREARINKDIVSRGTKAG